MGGTGYAQQDVVPPFIGSATLEPLAERLKNHSLRLGVATDIARGILAPVPTPPENMKAPEMQGANGWMLRSMAQVEDLISALEAIRLQVGQL